MANENIELSGLTVYFRQYEENKISLIIHSENNQSLQMQLFSTDGQGISNTNFKVQTGTNYFELDNLQAGIYFYRISDLTGKFNSGKFIKL